MTQSKVQGRRGHTHALVEAAASLLGPRRAWVAFALQFDGALSSATTNRSWCAMCSSVVIHASGGSDPGNTILLVQLCAEWL